MRLILASRTSTLLLFSVFVTFVMGERCTSEDDCSRGFFCNSELCRRESCTVSTQCDEGELCQYGEVKGRRKTACFPANNSQIVKNKNKFCSGGGSAVFNFDMRVATCDYTHPCPDGSLCNPTFGVCCTKLKTCPRPSKSMLNSKTGKPIMCQLKGGTVMQCPKDGYCEKKTGFCCHKINEEEKKKAIKENENEDNEKREKKKEDKKGKKKDGGGSEEPRTLEELIERENLKKVNKPWRGSACTPAIGCDGGAACICASKDICRCDCATEFGYTVSADGRTCQRVRRRLKEKCKSDLECSAAFSECATVGCRCRRGFQRDGDGGCKPINYQCVSKQSPLVVDNAVMTCNLRQQPLKTSIRRAILSDPVNRTEEELFGQAFHDPADSYSNGSLADSERDDCPEGHYCVAVFDNPLKRGYYQGFCCPSPTEINPVCPVGVAHESSISPDYGCRDCPDDHYCHKDAVSTLKEICCPKPCPSVEDVYMNGQCYSIAYYGDSCTLSVQCQYQKESLPEDEYTQLTQMECASGICSCPAGFSLTEGTCKRVMCTVGLRGEPSTDRFNNLIRCDRSADCSQGFMCDPNTKVCCKGLNRCPKSYVETGELCTHDDNCRGQHELCHRASKGKAKICCRLEESEEFAAKNWKQNLRLLFSS